MNGPKHPFKTFSRNPTQLGLRNSWRPVCDVPSCRSVTNFRESNSVKRFVTVRRIYDGPCCSSAAEFRDSLPVPKFSKLKYFGTEALDKPLCLLWFVPPVVEGNEGSHRRNFTSMGRRSPWRSVRTITVRRVIHWPSQFLSQMIQLLEMTKQVVTNSLNFATELQHGPS